MTEIFEGSADSVRVCPGEKACEIFQSAAGRNREAKEKNACRGCDLFSTKTDSGRMNHKALERLASEAMQLRVERLTGFPRDTRLVTLKGFVVLQIIEQIVEQKRILREDRLTEILMAGLGVKQGG